MSDNQKDLFVRGNGSGNVPTGRSAVPPPDQEEEPTPVEVVALGRGDVLKGKAEGPIKELIDDNFLQYASYVIRDRAIPDLDDGLKPVQRRILFSLHEKDDGKFIKVANIVGYCMQYHPHGDASIADALVALTNKRYLVEGQGNYGNIFTGDPAAASRYIECRLTELARTQLFNEQLTKFAASYDGRRKEPITLPAKIPLLLMLGAEGIAVGLSTRILPHNFKELIEAQIAVLKKKSFTLLPDFQHGGTMDASEYDKGNGRVRIRAKVEAKASGNMLIIREIPHGTTTESLIASIEDAVRKKKIKIRSIDDFTAEKVEIQVKYSGETDPEKVLQKLFAFTQCEVSISSRIVVIHKNRPREMNVDEILKHNTLQLKTILERELNLELRRLENELHYKTLIQIFIENRIYKRIEECKVYSEVQQAVLDGVNVFRERLTRDVTKQDVEMLLAIQIKRISRYDMNKNRKEIGDIIAGLDQVEKDLSDTVSYTVRYLRSLLKKYGTKYERRTRIEKKQFEKRDLKELTASELSICYDDEKGYLGFQVSGSDPLFDCSSYDRILVVWKNGDYKVIAPPEKLFVDNSMIHCVPFDKEKVYVMVYVHHEIAYMKKFTFGGAILNRDYCCTPPNSDVLLLEAGEPEQVYVKYKKAKNQKIHRQAFPTKKQILKGVKAKGAQITVKKIESISSTKPKHWDKGKKNPSGVAMDF